MMEQSYRTPDPYPKAPSRLCSQSRLMDYFTSPLYIEDSNHPRDFNSYKKYSSDWDIIPSKLKQEPISELCEKYRSKDTSELIKVQNEKSRNMSNANSDPNLKNYNKRQISKYTNKTSRIDLPIQDQEPHSNNCLAELEAQKSLSAQRTAARETLTQRSSVDRIIPRRQSLESPAQRGISIERPPRPPSSQRESTPQRLSRDSSLSRPFSREPSLLRPASSQRERQGAFASQKGFSLDTSTSSIQEYNEDNQPLSSSFGNINTGVSAPPAVRHDIILPSVAWKNSRSPYASP